RLDNAAGSVYAGRDLAMSAVTLANSGSLYAAGDQQLTVSGAVTNTGVIAAQGDTTLAAGSLESSSDSLIGAGILADGKLGTAGNLVIATSGALAAHGQNLAAGDAKLSGRTIDLGGSATDAATLSLNAKDGDIHLGKASVNVAGALELNASGTLDNREGSVQAGQLTVHAGLLDNSKGHLTAAAALDVTTEAGLDNTGGLLYAGGDTRLTVGGALANTGSIAAAGNADITAASVAGNGLMGAGIKADGSLSAAGDLTVRADGLLQAGGQTLAAGAVRLSGATVDVAGGQVGADAIAITARDGNVMTSGAQVSASQTLEINADTAGVQQLVNAGGRLEAQQLQLQVANLDNTRGSIVQTGAGDTRIATGLLDNTAGRIAVNSADLAVSATTLTNVDGKLEHAGSGALTITAEQLNDQRGQITGNNQVSVTAASFDHRHAATVGREVAINAGSLDNTDGAIGASAGLVVTGGDLDNTRGQLQAGDNATFTIGNLNNTAGSVFAGGDLRTTATNVVNSGSLYATGKQVMDVTGAIVNTGVLAAQGDLTVSAASLDSGASSLIGAGVKADGSLGNTGDLTLTASHTLTAHGQNLAAGHAALTAGAIDLASSETGAANISLTSHAGSISTAGAVVNTAGVLEISASAELNNHGGALQAGQLDLVAADLDNTSGVILQTGAGDTTIATGHLDNTSGRIAVNSSNLHLSATELINRSGKIEHAGNGVLAVQVSGLDNTGGRITSAAALDLASAGALDNTDGMLYAGRDAQLAVGGLLTNTGSIVAMGNNNVTAGALAGKGLLGAGVQADGSLGAAGDLRITTGGLLQASGQTLAAGSATLAGSAVDLSGGQVGADRIDITAHSGDVITSKALVSAGELLAITANGLAGQQLVNVGGQLEAGQLQLQVNNLNNTQGAIVQTGAGDTRIDTAVLDNTSGRIAVNSANLTLGAATLTNVDGKIEHAGTGALTIAVGQFNDQRGHITGNNLVDLRADNLDHRDAATMGRQVTVMAGNLDNSHGSLSQAGAGQMTVTATGMLDNTGGTIAGNGAALVTAGTLRNVDGRIDAAGEAALAFNQLDNTGGTVTAGADLVLTGGDVDNTRGQLQAAAGNATLAIGNLDNTAGSIFAANHLTTTAANVSNSGSLYAGGNQALTASGAVTNTGVVAAHGSTTLSANSLDSGAASLIGAGVNADGSLGSTGDLLMTTGQALAAHGQNLAAGTMALTGGGVDLSASQTSAASIAITATSATKGGVVTDQATVLTPGNLTIASQGDLHNREGVLQAGQLTLSAANLDNTAGTILQTGSGNTTITMGMLDNTRGRIALNSTDARLDTSQLINQAGKIEHAGSGSLAITAAQLNGGAGAIVGNGLVDIAAGTFDHSGATTSARQLHVQAGSLSNQGGTLQSATSAVVDVAHGLDNRQGMIAANGAVQVTAGSLDNTAGELNAGSDLTTTVQADLVNTGLLYAGRNQALDVGGVLTNNGSIAALGNTTVTAHDLAGHGLLAAGLNANGALAASGDLAVTTIGTLQASGQNLAAGQMTLTGAALDLAGSRTSAANIDLAATSGNVSTAAAVVGATGVLAITASGQAGQSLLNQGGQLNAGQIDFRLSNLNNVGGAIIQAGAGDAAIVLTGSGVLDNTAGRIAVNAHNLQLTAATIVNVDGKIEHAGTGALTMSATSLYGQRGQITGNGALDVRATYFDHRNASTMAQQLNVNAGTLDNRTGELLQLGAGKASVVASGTLDNGGGRIEGNGSVAVQAGTLMNQSGRILAGGMLEAGSNATIDNTGGTLAGATGLAVTATDLDNTRGTLQAYAGNATLQVRDLNNNGGSIYAGSLLTTRAANVANSGTLYGGAQTLDVTGALSNSGMIAAQGDTTLTAGAIDSTAGSLIAAGMRQDGQFAASGELRITAQQGLHAAGQNLAAGTATLTGASVDLSGSLTSAGQLALTATAGNISSTGATLYASGALTAAANAGQSWDNRLGQVVAGQLQVQVGSLDNRKGSMVQNGGGDAALVMRDANGVLNNAEGRIAVNSGNLTLGAATIDNTAGVITHAGAGQLAIQAGAFNDQRGQVTSNGAVNIAAGSIDHRNASTQAGRLSIDTGSFDNRQGELVQLGTAAGVIHVTQSLDNQGGLIASNGNTTIGAQNINNQGGVVQVAGTGALDLTAGAVLDNSNGGSVAAGGNATVHAGNVLNHGGTVTAGGSLGVTADQALDNTGGLLAANGNLDVRAASVDNAGGRLASVNGSLGVIAGQLRNAGGQVQAGGDMVLQTGALNNSAASGYAAGGSIVGRNVTINTGGASLDNYLGTIAATQVLDLQTGALVNLGGLLQAGSALRIDTHGNTLDNSNGAAYAASHGGASGGIRSGGALTLAVGNWNNAAGMLGAAGAIDGSTGYINNLGGSIVSSSGLSLTIGGLANQGGQIQAVGNLGLQAGAAAIDNSAGLIRSGATVTLGAASIVNTGTQTAGLGIEGRDVSLSAGMIDNRQGGLRADNNLSIRSSGQLNNASGLVSANNGVMVSDDSANRQLMIANAGGTIIGGASTALKAAGLTGVGSVMSKGDLSLDLSGNHIVEAGSQVIANRNATVTIGGNFVNDGKVQAGGTLVLGAANFDNNVTGDINAGATRVNVAGTLNNRGVIDGISTQVNAGTLNNIGTGRMYGDTLAIGAGTLNNSAEGGVAATIASRGALDIGATVINNSDHALIFSSGNMAIGGALDANGRATGAATSVTNASATIQALGDLAMRAGEVTLLNKNFKADYVAGSSQYISYYEVDGIKYDPSQVEMNPAPKVGYLSINIAGKKIYVYDYYAFTRTTSGSVVTSTDPGIISAGGDLTIDAYRVTNQNSQITAGKALAIHSQELINDFTASGTKITDVGRWDTYNYVYTDYLNGTGGSPETDEINRTEVIGGTSVSPGGAASGYQATTRAVLGTAGATSGASAANVNLWLNTLGNNAGPVAGVGASQGQGAAGVGGAAGPAGAGAVSGVGSANAVGAVSGAGAAAQGGSTGHGAAEIGLTNAAVANAQGATGTGTPTGTDRTGQVGPIGNGTTVAGTNAGAAIGTGGIAAAGNGALGNGLPGQVAGQQGFYDTDRAGNAGQAGNPVGGGNVAHNTGSAAPTLNDPGRLASATSGGATGIDRTGNAGLPTSIGAVGGSTASVGNSGATPGVGDPGRLAAATGPQGSPSGLGELIRAAGSVFSSAGAASVTGANAAHVDGSSTPAAAAVTGNTAAIGTVRGGANQAAASALSSKPRSPSIQQVALSNPSGKAEVVRTGAKPVQLPNASLFQVQPAVEARYLVETDPRFANYREWTGSDYMTAQIQLDPTVTQKRLGDGFYEQQLVREQVAELTGHRYTGDYSSDEEQYRGLMDAGVSYAQQWGLRPGVALSAEQMAALTSDIVWLVERDVTMADGSVQKALVPQVYVRLRADDIDGTGALLAGKDVDINLNGDLTNSGTIAGRDVVLLNAENVNNLAGRIDGDAVAIAARNDLNNISGAISANSTLQASAGRDINVTTSTLIDGSSTPWQPQSVLGRVAGLYVSGGADGSGSMALSAGRDISIAGAIVSNTAATGTTALSSGRDINLAGATVSGAATDGATILSAGRDLNLSNGLAGAGVNAAGLPTGVANVGSLVQGTKVALVAGNDINNTASNVVADQQLTASAGRDINLVTTTVSSFNQSRKGGNTITDTSTVVDKVAGFSVTGTGEGTALVVQAGRDINLTAAAIGNAGVNGQTSLVAGNNLNLKTVDIASSHDVVRNADNYTKQSTASEVGTQITGAGNVALQAGHDIVLKAAGIEAAGALALSAGNDINLVTGIEQSRTEEASKVKKSHTFSSKTTTKLDIVDTSNAIGNSLGAESIAMSAGRDLTITGSSVLADKAVSLSAGNDVTIAAAINSSKELHHTEVKQSGFLSGGGIGISYGTRTTAVDQERDAQTQSGLARSAVGALTGDLSITANNALKIGGSDLMAGADLNLAGRSVLIDPGQDDIKGKYEMRMTQDGFSLSLGGSVVNAIQTMQTMSSAASQAKDGRVTAMAAATAAMAAKNAAKDVAKEGANVSISLTYGHSENQVTQTTASSTHSGSVLSANNINIAASGGGADSNLSIVGSELNAKQDIRLHADNAVKLVAAQDTESQHTKTSSMSASAGIAATVGTSGTSFGITGSVSASKGHEDGSGTTQLNTHVNAGDQLVISSGGDTVIQGAVASGRQVIADVKGNLLLESLQDTAKFDSKSQSISVSGTVGFGASVSGSYSQTSIHNDYASVQEQTGIRAGDGGFQIKVGGNTDLKGAVISSTEAGIANNQLSTGTFTQSEIKNFSEMEASSAGVSGSAAVGGTGDSKGKGEGIGGTNLINQGVTTTKAGMPGVAFTDFSGSSITASGISAASIVIRNDALQQAITGTSALATMASINHNVITGVDTSGNIANGFDKSQTQATLGVTLAFSAAAATEVGNYASSKLEEAARLRDQVLKTTDPEQKAALNAQATEIENDWKEGGAGRVALHIAVGGVSGGTGGALGAGATAITTPVIAEQIARFDSSNAFKNALIIAAGAAVGGGIGGASGLATGANEVTNNFLKHEQAAAMQKEFEQCDKKSGGCTDSDYIEIRYKYLNLSNQNIINVESCIKSGDVACVRKLESLAASRSEISSSLVGADYNFFGGRQDNVNLYGSVAGAHSLFGSDAQQASEIEKFRAENCTTVSDSTCAGLVRQAVNDRKVRVAILSAVGGTTASLGKIVSGVKVSSSIVGKGALTEANFAQNKIRSDRTFSLQGQEAYSD
ncbi:MAG: hemagglutinin repeat-containing protein, partial [Duganella sp.]